MTEHTARLISEMTLEEKVSMAAGSDMWHGTGVERLDIPRLKVTDGPNGARGAGHTMRSACFPCGTSLGASWDVDLVAAVGTAIGEETKSKGAHLLLAPTINIHRTPLAGRNFECYSEDPFLTGMLASAYISGVQTTGVGATAKHFVGNDSEFERHTINSVIDERTLREVYLRPFEFVIDHAAPVAVMSSYNKVNGTSASDNRSLLTSILKDEWGYEGFVISDWYGTRTTVGAANAGLDLEMPGPARMFGEHLLKAVEAGEVPEEAVDDKVRRLLSALDRTNAFTWHDQPETSRDEPHHRSLARAAASAGTVMLNNDGGLLPLTLSSLKRVAVIGPNANESRIQGGGSAGVRPHYSVTPLQGLRAALEPSVEVVYEPGCNIDKKIPLIDMALLSPPGTSEAENAGRWRMQYRRTGTPDGSDDLVTEEPGTSRFIWTDRAASGSGEDPLVIRLSATLRPDDDGEWTFSLISTGPSRLTINGEVVIDAWTDWTIGSEFYGRACDEVIGHAELRVGTEYAVVVEFDNIGDSDQMAALTVGARPPVAHDLLERAVAAAAGADAVIMIVGQNSDWESESRDRELFALPGAQPELIARVAAANPRTSVFVNAGSAVDMTWAGDVATVLCNWYPGQENGNSIADIVLGISEPGGRLATTLPVRMRDTPSFGNYPGEFGEVRYGEGLLVGHRWYQTRDIAPAFAFGHGMSFTTFEWGEPTWSRVSDSGDLTFSVRVTNTGDRFGSDVVQIYSHRPGSQVARPMRQLVGFEKVHLGAGHGGTAVIGVSADELRHWDPVKHCWVLEPGTVEFHIARSSYDVQTVVTLEI